jgi:hypothetical protein
MHAAWKRISRNWRSYPAVLGLALFAGVAGAANDEIRIIQLRHRTVQEIIPLVRPLLGPNDAVTGTDYRLIIRAPEKTVREIERLLAQIDVTRRRLTITVKQAVVGDTARTEQSLSGDVKLGDHARLGLPRTASPDDRGLSVGGSAPDSLRYRTRQSTASARDENTQFVTTQDGQRAYVRVGQSIPHVQKILVLTGRQAIVAQGVQMQNVTTGFDVLPRVHGDRVHLEITPRLSTLENPVTGLVSFQELTTTVVVKFGDWIDLGGITGSGDEVRRAILESGAARSGERRTVLLKVE